MLRNVFGALVVWFGGMGLIYFGMQENGSARPGFIVWDFVSGFWRIVEITLTVGAFIAVAFIVISAILRSIEVRKEAEAKAIRRRKEALAAEECHIRSEHRERAEQAAAAKEKVRREQEKIAYAREQKELKAKRTDEDVLKEVLEQITRGY